MHFVQMHSLRHELRDVAAVLVDVAYHARRYAHQCALGEQEDGLQFGMQALVGMTNHVLVLEIAAATEASDDELGVYLLAEVGGETFVGFHLYLRIVLKDLFNPLYARLEREGGTLLAVDANGDI